MCSNAWYEASELCLKWPFDLQSNLIHFPYSFFYYRKNCHVSRLWFVFTFYFTHIVLIEEKKTLLFPPSLPPLLSLHLLEVKWSPGSERKTGFYTDHQGGKKTEFEFYTFEVTKHSAFTYHRDHGCKDGTNQWKMSLWCLHYRVHNCYLNKLLVVTHDLIRCELIW